MNNETLILRNLKDAGCSPAVTEAFLQFQRNGKTNELLKLLARQRMTLLRRVHANQTRIDCLDHLITGISKEKDVRS